MSNVTTRRFIVLSESVNTSDDVFNSLVEVKDKETGEVGTLLCSHMCNFPQELISQATWLEGCKTPELFKDEPRLVLGYHPEQYTQWRVFKETNEIEIYLTGSWNQDTEEVDEDDNHIYLHTNLPYIRRRFGDEGSEPQIKESILRLFNRVTRVDGMYILTQQSINIVESMIHRLFNSGKIDAWTASVLGSYILWEDEYTRIHWEGPPDLFLPEGASAFYNVPGIYYPGEESLPLRYSHFLKQWEVIDNIPGYYQKAVDCCFEYLDENNDRAIWYGDPDSLVIVDEDDNI